MGLREKKKKLTRQTILAKSAELFEKNGIAGTRLEDIADAAMVSRTTLFNYFSNKDAIVLALAPSFEESFPAFIRKTCDTPATTAQRIESIFLSVAEYFTRHRGINAEIYLEIIRIRSSYPENSIHITDEYHQALMEMLELGRNQGDVRADIDIARMADLIWSPLSTALYRIFATRENPDIQAIFKDYAQLLSSAITR